MKSCLYGHSTDLVKLVLSAAPASRHMILSGVCCPLVVDKNSAIQKQKSSQLRFEYLCGTTIYKLSQEALGPEIFYIYHSPISYSCNNCFTAQWSVLRD